MNYYETNIAHNAFSCGDKNTSKSGKSFGSVVANNLIPLSDIYRYIPPVMHVIMGLTNDGLKELKSKVISLDNAVREREIVLDGHQKQVQEKLIEMYDEVEDLVNGDEHLQTFSCTILPIFIKLRVVFITAYFVKR